MKLSAAILSFLFSIAVIVSNVSSEEEENAARLFVYKSTKTSPVVEGQPFYVTYQVINNGDGTATKIDVADRYDPNSFELRENVNEDGGVLFSLEELLPGADAVFNVTVQPKLSGIYESTRARVRYSTGMQIEDVEDDIRSGYSTSLGRIKIISAAEHLRNSSYWLKEWFAFFVFALLLTALPYNFWSGAAASTTKISVKRKAI